MKKKTSSRSRRNRSRSRPPQSNESCGCGWEVVRARTNAESTHTDQFSVSLASSSNSRMGFNLFKKQKPNFKLAHKKQTNMFPAISFTVGNFGQQQQQQQRKREWEREFRPLAAYQKKTRSRSVTLFAGGGRDSLGTRSNLKVQLNKSLSLSRPPTPFESVLNLMDYASKYWHLFRRVGTLHSLVYFGLLAGEIKLITPSVGEC